MSKFKKFFYSIMAILGLILFFVSMLPVFVGVINIGVLLPAFGGIFISLYSLLSLKYPMENIPWKREITPEYEEKIRKALNENSNEDSQFRRTLIMGIKSKNLDSYESGITNYVPGMIMSREKRAIIDRLIWILVVFAIIVTVTAVSIMKNGYPKYDGSYKGETVLILGAKIDGNEPSLSLRYRLEKAFEILNENKEAKCIVSGGKGEDELTSEASVMKRFLIEKGIDEGRIIEEDKAKNTEENIIFSKKLADELKVENNYIIITQEYHLFRANKYANSIGMKSSGEIAKTPKSTLLPQWMREIIAVVLQI